MSEENILFEQQDFKPFTEEECQNIKQILKNFIESYIKYKDTMKLDKWLAFELKNNLDGISEDEAKSISDEIIDSLKTSEESKESLKKAIEQGRSKESWFASQVKKAISDMNNQEAAEYLQELYKVVSQSNKYLYGNVKTEEENITLDWNEYNIKNMALEIGKKIGVSALQGVTIVSGMNIMPNAWQNDKIKVDEEIQKALKTGADIGLKVATTGALKVISEKGIVKDFSKKATSAIANIAYISIENLKTALKVAENKITAQKAIDEYESTTVSVIGGVASKGKKIGGKVGEKIGATIAKKIGPALSPGGAKIGKAIGEVVGHMAGTKVEEALNKGFKKVKKFAKEKIKSIENKVSSKLKNTALGKKVLFLFN